MLGVNGRLIENKLLPIHLVVQVLERNIMDVPAGQPAFADPWYNSFALNTDYFYPLPKLRNESRGVVHKIL
jgi:hypothetical protein